MSTRKRVRRERILEAAIRRFALQGFAGTPVTAIAEDAKVASGTVFWHFASKSHLHAEAMRHAGSRIAAGVRREAASESASLHSLLKGWMDTLEEDPDACGLLASVGTGARGVPRAPQPPYVLAEVVMESWRAALGQLESAGSLPATLLIDEFARLVVSVTCGWLATSGAARADEPLRGLREVVLSLARPLPGPVSSGVERVPS